jgi:hypothetical protein
MAHSVPGLDIDLTGSPMWTRPLLKRHDPPDLQTVPASPSMTNDELTERVSLAVAKWHLRAIDEWRRLQPEIPTRARAIRMMIEAAVAKDQPTAIPAKAAAAKRKAATKRP